MANLSDMLKNAKEASVEEQTDFSVAGKKIKNKKIAAPKKIKRESSVNTYLSAEEHSDFLLALDGRSAASVVRKLIFDYSNKS